MIQVDGPPSRWIAKGGRPARVVEETHDGIPSYESDTGKILVYDLLVATQRRGFLPGQDRAIALNELMFTPRGYGMCAALSVLVGDHELCALYDDPDAAWVWRPLLYRLNGGLERFGSQQELEWRWSLQEMTEHRHDVEEGLGRFIAKQVDELRAMYGRVPALERRRTGEKRLRKNARKRIYRAYAAEEARLQREALRLPFMDANDRADAILREHLNPQQLLELDATGAFYVRGTINELYSIRLGNGAAIVNPRTHHLMASLCLHPERWMPHADVALATKLAIESGPEREQEILAGARVRWLGPGRPSFERDRYAWNRERDLLPAPLEAAT